MEFVAAHSCKSQKVVDRDIRRCTRNLYRLSLEAQPRVADAGREGLGFDGLQPLGVDDLRDVAEMLGPFGVQVLDAFDAGFVQLPPSLNDEIVIDLTRPIDLPLIEHVLRPTGRKIVALQPI